MSVMEGIVGLFARKRGVNSPGEAGLSELTQSLLVQLTGMDYAELVWNGHLYTVSSGLVATPAASPLGAGGTPPLALWNPLGSNFSAIITRVGAFTTSQGTVAAKAYTIDVGKTADITQATIQRGKCNLVGSPDDNDLQGFTGVALTGSTALARLRDINAHGAGTTATNVVPSPNGEDVRGSIILAPGTLMALTARVLGTANEASFYIEYAKVRTL